MGKNARCKEKLFAVCSHGNDVASRATAEPEELPVLNIWPSNGDTAAGTLRKQRKQWGSDGLSGARLASLAKAIIESLFRARLPTGLSGPLARRHRRKGETGCLCHLSLWTRREHFPQLRPSFFCCCWVGMAVGMRCLKPSFRNSFYFGWVGLRFQIIHDQCIDTHTPTQTYFHECRKKEKKHTHPDRVTNTSTHLASCSLSVHYYCKINDNYWARPRNDRGHRGFCLARSLFFKYLLTK